MLVLEAKCYVAMAEVDYDLRKWYERHYSPSRSIQRNMIGFALKFRLSFERGVRDAQEAIERMGSAMLHSEQGRGEGTGSRPRVEGR